MIGVDMFFALLICMIGYDDWSWDNFSGQEKPPAPIISPAPDPIVITRPFIPSVSALPPNTPVSAGWLSLMDDDGKAWYNKDKDSLIQWVWAINASIARRKQDIQETKKNVSQRSYSPSPQVLYNVVGGC